MNKFIIAATVLGIACLARYADAAERTAKPVVCVDFRVLEPGLALCSDSKKPFLMRNYVLTVVPGQDTAAVRVLVGWR